MRVLKFRVFDTENGKYTKPQDWSISSENGAIRGMYGEEFPEMFAEQFTGLHDKNGKDIYEGDVVEYFHNHHGKPIGGPGKAFIRYNSDYGRYQIAYKNIVSKEVWDDIDGKFLRVIGNIHENPELVR